MLMSPIRRFARLQMYIPQAQSISSQGCKPGHPWKLLIIQGVNAKESNRVSWTARTRLAWRSEALRLVWCMLTRGGIECRHFASYGTTQIVAVSTKATGHPLA